MKMIHKPKIRVYPINDGKWAIELIINQLKTRVGGLVFDNKTEAMDYARQIRFPEK